MAMGIPVAIPIRSQSVQPEQHVDDDHVEARNGDEHTNYILMGILASR